MLTHRKLNRFARALRKRISRQTLGMAGMSVLLMPLAVEVDQGPQKDSETSFRIGFGGGQYSDVTRGCEGQILDSTPLEFTNAGIGVEHKFPSAFALGIRATMITKAEGFESSLENGLLWNPYIAYEGDKVGAGIGYVGSPEGFNDSRNFEASPVSFHIRVGSLEKFYVNLSVFENVPLYSGVGPAEFGIGFPISSRVDMWLGAASPIPYDQPGAAAKLNIEIFKGSALNFQGRYGSVAGDSEYSFSAGLTVGILH